MTSDKRNTNVMIALLGSLTLGALMLLWLEPRAASPDGGAAPALMATSAKPVEFATVEYVKPGRANLESYDCVVYVDRVEWSLRNSNARIAVVGEGGATLSDGCRRQLLTAIRDLTRSTGLSPNQIRLAADLRGDAASSVPEAADLVAFLRAKSFVR